MLEEQIMPFLEFDGKRPKVHDTCFISPNATIIGDVTLERETSVWPNAVLRGDLNKIVIGERTSIQENCIIHVTDTKPTVIGNDVIMGHGAIAHACKVGNHVLLGIGSCVLDGAVIGDWVIVAAGAVVTEDSVVSARTLVAGIPAQVKKELDSNNLDRIEYWTKEYVKLSYKYRESSTSSL